MFNPMMSNLSLPRCWTNDSTQYLSLHSRMQKTWAWSPSSGCYLIKHKHWSPFEMASMCLEIHTTRAISLFPSFSFSLPKNFHNAMPILILSCPIILTACKTRRTGKTPRMICERMGKIVIHLSYLDSLWRIEVRSLMVSQECLAHFGCCLVKMYMHVSGHGSITLTRSEWYFNLNTSNCIAKNIFKEQFPLLSYVGWGLMKCDCNSTNTRVTVTEHHDHETWRYYRCLLYC